MVKNYLELKEKIKTNGGKNVKVRYYIEEHVMTKPSCAPSVYVHNYPNSLCGIIHHGGPYKCHRRAINRYNKIKIRGVKNISDNYKHIYVLLKMCTDDKGCNTLITEISTTIIKD